MKIYFSGSIRAGREHQEHYAKIIGLLGKYGKILTEHIGDPKLSAQGELNITDDEIYERDMRWLKESDIVVADVSVPATGVGYEIAYAEILGKKVLCLYYGDAEKKISGMISGNRNLTVKTYKTAEDLERIFNEFFK